MRRPCVPAVNRTAVETILLPYAAVTTTDSSYVHGGFRFTPCVPLIFVIRAMDRVILQGTRSVIYSIIVMNPCPCRSFRPITPPPINYCSCNSSHRRRITIITRYYMNIKKEQGHFQVMCTINIIPVTHLKYAPTPRWHNCTVLTFIYIRSIAPLIPLERTPLTKQFLSTPNKPMDVPVVTLRRYTACNLYYRNYTKLIRW